MKVSTLPTSFDDLLNGVKSDLFSGLQTSAANYIREQTYQGQKAPTQSPVQAVPTSVSTVQSSQTKFIFYGAIAIAVVGAAFLIFGRKGKK